jgi:hypothetical protein
VVEDKQDVCAKQPCNYFMPIERREAVPQALNSKYQSFEPPIRQLRRSISNAV